MNSTPTSIACRELRPPDGYQDWIRTQFAGGDIRPSLVNGNVVADLVNQKAFLDLSAYMDSDNPYTGKPWRDRLTLRRWRT